MLESEYTQIKFNYSKNNTFYPQIEYRFQAITVPEDKKMLILTKEDIQKLTEELWQNIEISKNNLSPLSIEYQFILLCTIFYFEDNLKGLNNLYRIWLLKNKEKNRLNWEKIGEIADKFKVQNIITFIFTLAEREFSLEKSDLQRCSTSIKLTLRLIDLDFICRAYLPSDKKDFRRWVDGYIYFLTRGFLAEEPIWQKVLFFTHPKRFLFLILGLTKLI